MRLSIYTFVKDALYFDYHLLDMLRHHLPLADEIVVSEGYSSDRTYEAIRDFDPKVIVHRNRIDATEPKSWLRRAKDSARVRCTGDWCLLLDCDEFIPEWEFERLRRFIETTPHDIAAARYTHFYGNYKVYYHHPERGFPPPIKQVLHRNLPDIEILGDGSDVRRRNGDASNVAPEQFECHHFGEVRKASRLRHKWRVQANRDMKGQWDWMPAFLFDLFPHKWATIDVLPYLHAYEGPFVKAVVDNPKEFVRDRFVLYDAVRQKSASS